MGNENPEKNEDVHRFILLEPTETGMTVGIYGLTGIEAVGLLRAGLVYAERRMNDQITMVVKHPAASGGEDGGA